MKVLLSETDFLHKCTCTRKNCISVAENPVVNLFSLQDCSGAEVELGTLDTVCVAYLSDPAVFRKREQMLETTSTNNNNSNSNNSKGCETKRNTEPYLLFG